ncbi:efflux RND transporter periplasmic adaptor subunit [Brevundimonas sp.]|uniref:efflux RND transporter periplasmic adaptor subunit n=1 Tax=Brevundimonas sp. TaxID=1871086 RepID=UPI002AB85423|nr:efflux RND transporter periplasmic adaptor subunit [Brevundimonas sp.]MDZ4365295.1 efflux RND transporter periplasmic adaptor subunit [Brevundimonas sp.]
MTATPISTGPLPKKPRRRRNGLTLALAVGAGVLALIAIWFFFLRGGDDADPYRTEAVSRGEIVRSVSASGTLEALVTVEVGSQISGQVTQVLVDYNDRVTRGQTLAILDPQNQRSAVEQSQAQIASAQAQVSQAEAQVALAQAEYDRQKFLFDRGIVAQAALDTASASLRTARASVQSANAQVRQQQASLRANQATLGRTSITAPISGIVIDRQIEPGQTVASGLNVAVLFTLAQDLSRVQALISVDEADIGSVRLGQPVRFTVDAFANDNFTGEVTQIRMLPTAESSVVAYTVVVEADNPGERLLPGMTANADIILEQRRGVLRVPNSALRFTPAGVEAEQPARRANGVAGATGAPGGGGGQRSGGRGNMAASIIAELNLDAAQLAKVQPILDRAQQEARAASRAQGGGGQGRRGNNPAMAAAFNKAFDEIKPLLRADQQTTLETLRGRFAGGGGRGTVWVLVDGEPVQRSVRTGATDGSYTEVLSGLNEGDQVITGGGPRAVDTQAQAQAARMTAGGGAGGGGPRGF